jgi:hypothetical protein
MQTYYIKGERTSGEVETLGTYNTEEEALAQLEIEKSKRTIDGVCTWTIWIENVKDVLS